MERRCCRAAWPSETRALAREGKVKGPVCGMWTCGCWSVRIEKGRRRQPSIHPAQPSHTTQTPHNAMHVFYTKHALAAVSSPSVCPAFDNAMHTPGLSVTISGGTRTLRCVAPLSFNNATSCSPSSSSSLSLGGNSGRREERRTTSATCLVSRAPRVYVRMSQCAQTALDSCVGMVVDRERMFSCQDLG